MGNETSTLERELLLSILDNLPTPIFVKDKELRYVYSNKKHSEIMGYSEAELLGKTDTNFLDQKSAQTFMDQDRQVLKTGATNQTEDAIKLKDGLTSHFLTHKAQMLDRHGDAYLIGTNTNIDEQRSREEAYSQLAAAIPIGIFRLRDDDSIAFSNDQALSLLGLAAPPASASQLGEILGLSAAEFPGKPNWVERDIKVNNGLPGRRLLLISSGWLPHITKRRKSAILSVVDVSELSQLKQSHDEVTRLNSELADSVHRLQIAQDELIKRGKMEQLGQLTATVAHELRNPLGAVRTSSFLLERKLKDKGLGVEPQLQRISHGITRCDNIITQLLDFSRSKSLTPSSTDLDDWLVKLLEEESKKLPETLTIKCQLGLDGLNVPFDSSRLQRAVLNMISNAVEAMVGQGDAASKVATSNPLLTISTSLVGDHVAVSVNDNGPGIKSELLAKIREPLFTTKSFGTGLGVPAIEQIAMQHGGRLEIHSVFGEGSTFTVILPLVHVAQDQTADAA
jgi:PAS domain S-box-containing protein